MDRVFEGMDEIPKLEITRNVVETYEIPYQRNPVCCMCHDKCNEVYAELYGKQMIEKMRTKRENAKRNSVIGRTQTKRKELEKEEKVKVSYAMSDPKVYYNFAEDEDSFSESELDNNETYFAYYFCSTCNEIFCIKCGEEITDIMNTKKMHNHFLFYVHTNNKLYMKYILLYNVETSHETDFKYFFENAKTEKLSDLASHYQVKCDSCLSFPVRTVRWKCCNCISKNICDVCEKRLENKEDGYYEDIIWNMHQVGCDPLQHVFMKIIFDCFVY